MYLKELVDPKIRKEIDGLPFSSEGYEKAQNILKRKYGKPSEAVNAYVENIMSLSTINGSQPNKIHEFYEKLLFNVQSLETMGKLQEVNGYVRMTIDKLPGIRGDLVRTDDSWREWDFSQLVGELRKWTERSPIHTKSNEKPLRDKSYQTKQKDERGRECVYCGKPNHRSVDCVGVCSSNSLATRRGTRNLIYILPLFFLFFLQLLLTQQVPRFYQLVYFYSTFLYSFLLTSTSSSIVAVLIAKAGHVWVS